MAYDIIVGRDASDKERFGDKGLIYIGKGYVKMGNYTSLSNKIYMDVARSHVVLVAGKRGSGKSHSLGVIAEELSLLSSEASRNIASLIFDTMGIFWTMKYKNEKDKDLLREWQLENKSLPVRIFVPFGKIEEYREKNIPVDNTFAIKISELEAEDWIVLFNLPLTSLPAVLIQRIITELKDKLVNFTLEDIQMAIEHDRRANANTKEIASTLFSAADNWGIFSREKEGTEISDLVKAGVTSVLDVSVYSSIGAYNIRALVISLITRKLFKVRMDARKEEELDAIRHGQDYLSYGSERAEPLVWIFVDECLTGDTEIITSIAHTPMQEIINKFEKGENIEVLGFDIEKNKFAHYPVTQIYKKGKRKIIKITTETGKEIKCTPEHRVLTRGGFASAFSVKEIATPIIQHYSEDKKCIKARILGHLFGDGWASKKTQSLGFSGKINPEDLNTIKKDLQILGLKSSNIYSRKTVSKIKNNKGEIINVIGTSHSIQASRKAFKYFEDLGIIKGDKIIQATKVPEWIKNGNEKIKSEFFAALMGSDGQTITSSRNVSGDFNAIRFSFNKLEKLEKEAFEYANELKELLESLGIGISKISKREWNIRKNGDKTIKIVITLRGNIKNTINFLEKVGYRYSTKKEREGNKWLHYLKARQFIKNAREKIYEKAKELHKKGLGKTKISKELRFPEAQIRDWLYLDMKPGLPKNFPDFDEWIENRLNENILYEKVVGVNECGEEEVYDLSVSNVHNFVSNGLITHNCHEFLPRDSTTPATDALKQLLREGRQPGISLVLATQQPGQIHRDAMTQSDIIIAHRVTSKPDVEALNNIMQTYLLEDIKQQMDDLPSLKGSAIILDDNSERLYPIRIRPRFTWHGGEAPSAIRAEVRI